MNPYFSDAQRRECIDILVSKGAKRADAAIAVDLALHAQEEAVRTFSERLKVAPDTAIMLSAFQIGTMILRTRFNDMAEATTKFVAMANAASGARSDQKPGAT